MLEILNQIDSAMLLLLNSYHTEWLDNFMMLFTGRFVWIPMYLVFTIVVFKCYGWKQAIVVMIGIGLAITMADQICATVIRPLVGRMRPTCLDNPLSEFVTVVNGYRGGRHGFPSCHAANSFALVAYLSLLIPHRRFIIFLIVWAMVNCYSRMYLGVHYPGDILVGGIIGSMIGYACACGVDKSLKRMNRNPARFYGTSHYGITNGYVNMPFVRSIHVGISDFGLLSGMAVAIVLGLLALG